MKKKELQLKYVHAPLSEFDEEYQILAKKAKSASEKAHAPYSKFKVGAAVELEHEGIILGSNQENASYPVGLCAERVAIFYAHSQYPDDLIKKIAVYAPVSGSRFIPSPCGSCRQVIAEFRNLQDAPIEVMVMNDKEEVWLFDDILDLLPFDFNAMHLIR